MNALPVATSALPVATSALPVALPSPAPASARGEEHFSRQLEAAEASLERPLGDGAMHPGAPAAGDAGETEAAEEIALVAQNPGPGLPWPTPWAAYVNPPAAPVAPPRPGTALPPDEAGPGLAVDAAADAMQATAGGKAPQAEAGPAQPGAAAGVAMRPSRLVLPAAADDAPGPDMARAEAGAGASGRATPAAAPVLPAQEGVPAPAAPKAEVLQETATVPVAGNTHPSAQHVAPRGEAPTVPGAPAPLHPGALQERIDTALRWMAGGGLQTAQLRVDPEALGPITIHLRLDGDVANVVFGSNHESTRQALENSIAGLKEALAAGGLSLGQASVGSERQSGFMAAQQFGERGADARASHDTSATEAHETSASGAPPAGPARSGHIASTNRMVDLYA